MKLVLQAVFGLFALAVVGIGLFIVTFDPNSYKDMVTQQLSQSMDRTVTVAGPVSLSLENGLSLGLKQASIGNPEGFPDKTFASAGEIFVSVDWLALLDKKVIVTKVKLADAKVIAVTNTAGVNNWDIKFKDAKKEKEEAPKNDPSDGFNMNSVALNNVELSNTTITQVDMRKGGKQEFFIEKAGLKVPSSGSFHGDAKGKINGTPFDINLDTKKSLRDVKEGTPIPFVLKLSYGGQNYDIASDLSFKGKTYRLDKLKAKVMGIDATGDVTANMETNVPMISGTLNTSDIDVAKLQSPKVASNGKLLATTVAASSGVDMSALRSFNSDLQFSATKLILNPTMAFDGVAARIKVANGALSLGGMKATFKGSPWTGNINVTPQGSVPMVTGDLTTPSLDVTKLAPAKAAANDNSKLAKPISTMTATSIAAGAAPDLSALRMFNSDIGFTTAKLVVSPTMEAQDISTRIKVSNGALLLNPLKFTYKGIPLNGIVSADANSNVRAAFDLKNVDFDQLAQTFGSKSPVHSKGDITFDLAGRGLDANAFMSTMTGKIEMVSGPGNVDFDPGNGISAGLVKSLVPAAATEKAKLTCAVARFNANNGILTSNGLLLDSNYATVAGNGSVNMKAQTLDITLKPVPKGATTLSSLTTAVPVHISGPLAQPGYSVEPDAVLSKALGGLLTPGQKISTGVPRVDANATGGNPCVLALNNPQPIMVDPPKTEQMFKDVRDTVKDVIKDPTSSLGSLLGGGKKPAAATPAAAPAAATPTSGQPPAPAPAPADNKTKAIDALKGLLGK
jgi:uncharacterized protein involved in outer membrane biogenesis